MTPTKEHIERLAKIGCQEFLAHPAPVHYWRNSERPLLEAAFRSAVKAILAALSADGWQMERWEPIETAPKDGTYVLVCGGTYRADSSHLGPWPTEATKIACHTGGHSCVGHCWRGGQDEGYYNYYWYKPTHWMPLPKPPGEGQ